MMLWGTMPNVRVMVPKASLLGRFLTWMRSTPRAPQAHIMTPEEYKLLMAKRCLIGRGQCQHCGAGALGGVCDWCWEMMR